MGIIVDEAKKFISRIENWGRKNSLWAAIQPIGCCGIEMICMSMPHYDADRWGGSLFRISS